MWRIRHILCRASTLMWLIRHALVGAFTPMWRIRHIPSGVGFNNAKARFQR